jgi:hypothetical protein
MDNLAEEEELAQERYEIQQIVDLGYLENDVQRALQQRHTYADAKREWQQDEEAQELFSKADKEAQEKIMDDVRSANRAANIEAALEKLVSGAIVITATEEVPARAQFRAADGSKETEEEKNRPRRLNVNHNAPTPEEIAKGLTRRIQCIFPLEEQERVYVGTDEGQVLVCSCDPNFTIRRWITQPGPNIVAVTCLDAVFEPHEDESESFGLLLVGTQDGSAHIYGLPNLRLAGSILIGRILPEADPESGDLPLKHVRLLRMPVGNVASIQFPFVVLTIDRRSRFRLWGIRMHRKSGKLEELALLLDGGQLPEIKEELVKYGAVLPADLEESKKETAKALAQGVGVKSAKDEQARLPARVTTVCAVKGQVVLPLSAVPGARPPGSVEVVDSITATPSAAFAALAAAFAAAGGADDEAGAAKDKGKVKFEEEADVAGGDDSDTDLDDRPETLEIRKKLIELRPSTPDSGKTAEGVPHPPSVAAADGANYIFFGDAVGRIWCLDAVGSACDAHEGRDLLAVHLDASADSPSAKSRPRPSVRFGSSSGPGIRGVNMSTSPSGSPNAFLAKQSIPAPAPEALKIATSWQAHEGYIVSLVPTTSPPALVSTDGDKHVRVWSTSGELWGHFQMAGVEPGNTFVWPPPHVLAAQRALMKIAKDMCKRMGLRTSGANKEEDSKKSRLRRSIQKKTSKGFKDKDKEKEVLPFSAPERKAKNVEISDENLFDDDDDVPGDGEGEKPGLSQEEKEKRKVCRREHFDAMVRNHGFSNGFKSYQHFQSKASQQQEESPTNASRRKVESLANLHKERVSFFKRDAADFGVMLGTRKDSEHWTQSTRNMGSRSCSEGALLRYAQAAVESMSRTVYDELGVDVSRTDMKQLRKPSFVMALDVRKEVTPEFHRDPSSSTAQVVQKIFSSKLTRSASAPRRMTALHSAGNSMVASKSNTK